MRYIIPIILFICFCVPVSKMYSQDYFPITQFSSKELAKGEPLDWKTHKGICREIKNRIMPRILEIEGRKTLYVKTALSSLGQSVLIRKNIPF